MVAWYIILRHYKSRVKKDIGKMAEAEGKSWVFFRMNFAALLRLWRNSQMLMMFWHVLSSSDLYTGREMFIIMSLGDETDEGKQKYLLIQLFYFRNYETDFGRVRLQIMVFYNTILL